jgi:hypothetical protein
MSDGDCDYIDWTSQQKIINPRPSTFGSCSMPSEHRLRAVHKQAA